MNIVELAGRLGADPEVRYTANNLKVTTLRVAANSYRGGKEETIWWRVTIWGDRFDKMLSFMKKGSAIIVIGELHKPEIWTNRNGEPQVSMEMTAEMIKFSPFGKPDSLSSSDAAQGTNEPYSSLNQSVGDMGAQAQSSANHAEFSQSSSDDDGLPF